MYSTFSIPTHTTHAHTHTQEILQIRAQAQQELLEEQQKHERDQFKILQQVRIVQHTPRTYTHHSHTERDQLKILQQARTEDLPQSKFTI